MLSVKAIQHNDHLGVSVARDQNHLKFKCSFDPIIIQHDQNQDDDGLVLMDASLPRFIFLL